MVWNDILGYIGTVIILISLTMPNMLRLRTLNMIGGITISIYGFSIGSIPVGVLNSLTASVHLFYIARLLRQREQFDYVPIESVTNKLFSLFMDKYGDEIHKIFPFLDDVDFSKLTITMLLRDLHPAGILAYMREGEKAIIHIDYVTPQYRDYSNSTFIFKIKENELKKMGITIWEAKTTDKDHINYLIKSGFKACAEPHIFQKTF